MTRLDRIDRRLAKLAAEPGIAGTPAARLVANIRRHVALLRDEKPAATPQGGETNEVIPFTPLQETGFATMRANMKKRQPAAAPVEEGREEEAETVATIALQMLDSAVKASRTLEQARLCLDDLGVAEFVRAAESEYQRRQVQNRPAASRAPHEGPTSGLREAAQEFLDYFNIWYADRGNDAAEFHMKANAARLAARLAASPLAPTSDGKVSV